MPQRSFELAKLLERQPLHTPKRPRPHLAEEYEELQNFQVAHELRRHLRGCSRDLGWENV